MKTKLKHIFLLAALCFGAIACGSGLTKPVSGLDVSRLSAQLLSIPPVSAGDGEEPEGQTLAHATKTTYESATAKNQ